MKHQSPATLRTLGLFLIPGLFLGLFYFYPLYGILVRSFSGPADQSLSILAGLFQSPRMAGIVWFSVWQAAVSTLLTVAAALPCAYVMATYRFRGRRLLLTLSTLPFVLPTIVVATAFKALGGGGGWFGFDMDSHGLWMIFFAHVFYNFSVVLRIIVGYWSGMGSQMKEAAAVLGATPLQGFFYVTLPLLRPALMTAAFLVFVFCFSSFGVILILGGPSVSTIEVEIYRQAAHLFNLPMAATLSLLQIAITFLLMWQYALLQKKQLQTVSDPDVLPVRKPRSVMDRVMVGACVGFIALFCLSPMAALIIKSLWTAGGISPAYYTALFDNPTGSIFHVPPIKAMSNSLMFALATLGLALVVGGSAAMVIHRARKGVMTLLDPLFMLPLSTSAVTLGFGMIITLDHPPLDLRTSPWLVPLAHTLVAFPFVIRSLLPALSSIPDALREAASVLGASPFQVRRHVDMPIIARSLTVGALFAFTISMGEFGATLFAARPEYVTLPVAIYRFLSQPGTLNHGQAMAVSSLLMLVTASGFMLIERLRPRASEGIW